MAIPNDLLERVMALDASARAELLCQLLLSLEPEGMEPDEEYEESWKAEIEARRKAVAEGRTRLIPWEEVKERLRKPLVGSRKP